MTNVTKGRKAITGPDSFLTYKACYKSFDGPWFPRFPQFAPAEVHRGDAPGFIPAPFKGSCGSVGKREGFSEALHYLSLRAPTIALES